MRIKRKKNVPDKIPRKYQMEALEKALNGNVILCLPTGSGKTFIAILVLRESASLLNAPISSGGKRAFFLVPTKVLVDQQAQAIEDSMPDFKVGRFTGETGEISEGDNASSYWPEMIDNFAILVMTRRIFLDILNSGYVECSAISALIFDEVHHGAPNGKGKLTNDDYVKIMDVLKVKEGFNGIRIIGLTASLINNRWVLGDKLTSAIRKIEDTFVSEVYFPDIARAHNANEVIWLYSISSEDVLQSVIPEQFRILAAKVALYSRGDDGSGLPRTTGVMMEDSNVVLITTKQMIRTYDELKRICFAFGPWSLNSSLKYVLASYLAVRSILAHNRGSFVNIVDAVIESLVDIQTGLQTKLESLSDRSSLLTGITNKMLRLLQVLFAFDKKDSKDHVSAIIFVERRLDAYALSTWLNAVSSTIPEYSFIKAAFTVGCTTFAPFPFNRFLKIHRETILKDFRNRKINILVSTSVLEEGLDINHCNLIIRYDEAKTFRAYVQSKGRARSKEAYFVFFTPEENQNEFHNDMKTYHLIEQKLPSCKRSTSAPESFSRNETMSEYLLTSSGAILPVSESKIKVLLYCDRLPHDKYTRKAPVVKIKSNNGQAPFVASLQLPKLSPLHSREIFGRKCLSPTEAERYAYYETCKELWAYQELDDNFSPYDPKILINRLIERYQLAIDKTEIRNWTEECRSLLKAWKAETASQKDKIRPPPVLPPKPGTRKKRRYYPMIYSPSLLGYRSIGSPSWIYKVKSAQLEDPTFSPLGLITFRPLPLRVLEDKLSIYSTKEKVSIKLELIRTCVLSESRLEQIRQFQDYIYKGGLRIGLDRFRRSKIEPKFTSESPLQLLYIFLARDNTIDYSSVKQTYVRRPITELDYPNLKGSLISKNYGLNRVSLFLVDKVDHKLSPKSTFPFDNKDYETYEDYYKDRYEDIPDLNPSQPLLCCYESPTKTYFPGPLDEPKSKSTKALKMFHLIPQLCSFEHFSSACINTIYIIPALTILINRLLVAEDLRQRLCTEIGYGDPVAPADVKLTWDRQRFSRFDPLKVETIEYKKSTNPIDLSHVICTSHEPTNTNLANLLLEDASSEDDSIETDEDYDTQTDSDDESEDDEFDELKKEMASVYAPHAEAETREFIDLETGADRLNDSTSNGNQSQPIRVFRPDQMSLFSPLTPPDVEPTPWSDKDINLKFDIGNFSRKMFNYCHQFESESSVETKLDDEPAAHGLINDFSKENHEITTSGSIYRDRSDFKYGLPVDLIIEAMTTKKANSVANLERLEIIGDSFLKYIVSAFLFLKLPELNEARITWLKMNLICNFHFLNFGRSKGLAQLINDQSFDPRKNWLPPFYTSTHQEFTHNEINDKCVADMIEAMVGAHLVYLGEDAAVKFLTWLGMPFRPDQSKLIDSRPGSWLPLYDDVVPEESPEVNLSFSRVNNLHKLEQRLGYTFKRKDLLIEALTHPSWIKSHYNSYQRLEFLGDAVLDYLITAYIYDHPKYQNLKPGEVTLIRSALVNNDYFASIVIVNKLDGYLFNYSPTLHSSIVEFRQQLSDAGVGSGASTIKLGTFLLDSMDADLLTEAPKALGDMFESIAGAIYLDSGNSLATVWRVFSPFLGNELEFFCDRVPRSPIQRLFEGHPSAKFSKEKIGSDGKNVRKRLRLTVDNLSFVVNEKKLVEEENGISKRLERLSLVLSALNKLENHSSPIKPVP